MATASPPSYAAQPIPSYTEHPQTYEQRIAHVDPRILRHLVDFIKQSKNGEVKLRLAQQEENITLPVYGCGGIVAGSIDLAKTEGVTSVEVKVEGKLRLKELGGSGDASSKLCLERAILWVKDRVNGGLCPNSLVFSLALPTTFTYGSDPYPLPPTYEVHLSGVPGFTANIDYSVSAIVNKPNTKSIFGITIGNTHVSTPFIYIPRTRPAFPLPLPMRPSNMGPLPTAEWKAFDSVIRAKHNGGQDINSKLYLPASRIFCANQPIPFHLIFTSSAFSLASFLPLTPPTANLLTPGKQYTRIELLRQSTVDVRNTMTLGTKTDMWRVDRVGKGSFRHAGDGPNWIAFSGEITIDDEVKLGGFKAGGLMIKDCIVLSMDPPDPTKAPFTSLRQVVPIRLTTDPFIPDGSGVGGRFSGSEYSIPSSPEEHLEAQPELLY